MRRVDTRTLLTCAAIGVAAGLVFVVSSTLHVIVVAGAPVFYGALIALYFAPGAVAQSLLRRPLVAVLTALIAGVVVLPFQGLSFVVLGPFLLIGALQELPFAVTRYRRFARWLALVGAVFGGLVLAVAFHFAMHLTTAPVWVIVVQFVLTPAAVVLVTWLAWLLGAALQRAGVGRR